MGFSLKKGGLVRCKLNGNNQNLQVMYFLFLRWSSFRQKSDVMSELALANVEALASNGESEGINWRGYYLDIDNSCCKIGRYSDECSGKYTTCGD